LIRFNSLKPGVAEAESVPAEEEDPCDPAELGAQGAPPTDGKDPGDCPADKKDPSDRQDAGVNPSAGVAGVAGVPASAGSLPPAASQWCESPGVASPSGGSDGSGLYPGMDMLTK